MKNQSHKSQPLQDNSSEGLNQSFRKSKKQAVEQTPSSSYLRSKQLQSEPSKIRVRQLNLVLVHGTLSCVKTGQQFPTTKKGSLDKKKYLEQISRMETICPKSEHQQQHVKFS